LTSATAQETGVTGSSSTGSDSTEDNIASSSLSSPSSPGLSSPPLSPFVGLHSEPQDYFPVTSEIIDIITDAFVEYTSPAHSTNSPRPSPPQLAQLLSTHPYLLIIHNALGILMMGNGKFTLQAKVLILIVK
jgi:hypothetical protein